MSRRVWDALRGHRALSAARGAALLVGEPRRAAVVAVDQLLDVAVISCIAR